MPDINFNVLQLPLHTRLVYHTSGRMRISMSSTMSSISVMPRSPALHVRVCVGVRSSNAQRDCVWGGHV